VKQRSTLAIFGSVLDNEKKMKTQAMKIQVPVETNLFSFPVYLPKILQQVQVASFRFAQWRFVSVEN
jgi:hypothetical protein